MNSTSPTSLTSFLTAAPGIRLATCALGPGWGAVEVAVTLVQGERLAVFDTGVRAAMPAAIEPALADLGATLADIDLIVNTHGHWDHVEGNEALKAASHAPVWIPALDAGLLATPPDHELADGDEVDLGGWRFTVVHTPGHSPGMACFYAPDQRLLIVSDAVQGYGLPGGGIPLYFHSGQQYRASIERLLTLDVDTLVLGHAFDWPGPASFVQRGADARAFLQHSHQAAIRTGQAAQTALDTVGPADWEALQKAFIYDLAGVPGFRVDSARGLSATAKGSLRSELRDHGIEAPA